MAETAGHVSETVGTVFSVRQGSRVQAMAIPLVEEFGCVLEVPLDPVMGELLLGGGLCGLQSCGLYPRETHSAALGLTIPDVEVSVLAFLSYCLAGQPPLVVHEPQGSGRLAPAAPAVSAGQWTVGCSYVGGAGTAGLAPQSTGQWIGQRDCVNVGAARACCW